METNMENEETSSENKTILSNDKGMPSAPDLDKVDDSNQQQGLQGINQGVSHNDFSEEPRDDDDNPDVSYSSDSTTPSHQQTGQLPTELPDESDADDDIEDERRLSFLAPVVCLIAAIVVVWVMRLFLPLIQAFAGSTGGQKAVYGCMLALPVFLIAVAILLVIRVFRSLSAGVDCWYSPDYKAKRALREKLIRKYLNGFKTDKSLCRLIGGEALTKLELLRQGAFRLVCSWSLNLFLSSQLQGWANKISSTLGAGVNIAVSGVSSNPVAGKMAGDFVGKVAGAALEGGINRHMAKSLGDKAIKYFAAVKGLENVV